MPVRGSRAEEKTIVWRACLEVHQRFADLQQLGSDVAFIAVAKLQKNDTEYKSVVIPHRTI